MNAAAATAYRNSAACRPVWKTQKGEKAQKTCGFRAIGTYGLCIKDNVLIDVACGTGAVLLHLAQAGLDAEGTDISVIPLQVRYPQGSEKQLINAITGRTVRSGGLPMDAGCVVQNVGTAAALSDAVVRGIPLVERIVTVTGDVVASPGNWRLKLGTPAIEAVKLAGGVTEEPGKLIFGGPMMGFAQKSFQVPVAKNTSGILLLPAKLSVNYEASGCIRCGRCVQGCPMHLMPCLLSTAIEAERFDLALQNHVMDCMECGSCAYVCPDHRPLVQNIRRAKAELRRQLANRGK